MKKILLILFCAIAMGANAQIWYNPIKMNTIFKDNAGSEYTGGCVAVNDSLFIGEEGGIYNTVFDTSGVPVKWGGSLTDGKILQVVDGKIVQADPAFAAGDVTGLNPTEGLYGAADGTIGQDGEWTYDDATDSHLILSDDINSGYGVMTTDFSKYAVIRNNLISIQGVSHNSDLTSDEIASYRAIHQYLHITPDPGAWDGYTNITTAGTDDVINWVLPNAQGGANTFLKNDGSGNLSWGVEPSLGTVTSFSFTDGGGFDGTVTNATTTPTLSIIPSFTGLTYSDGSAFAAATVNSPLSFSAGALSISTAGDWTGTFDGQEGSFYLNRTNHTGTQLSSTISDFNEAAQDAVGGIFNASIAYVDLTPLISIADRDFGDITTTSSGTVMTIDNLAVTDAKINDLALGKITGLGTGVATWLATPSSANLRSALTDENGSGVALFDNATSATLVTPTIGAAVATSVANSTANNCKLTFASTGFQMVRNIADGNTLLELNQSNASSTGRIIDAQLNGTTKFQVAATGSTVVFKDSNDGTHAFKVAQNHASATGTIITCANNTGDVLTITQPGKIGLYNGITTANNGALTSVGTPVHLTGQTANIGATSCYTTTADGFYSIYWNAAITTAATTGAATATLGHFQVQYTNVADNVVKTTPTANNVTASTANATTGTGSGIGGVITVYAKSGTNINYIMGYSSNTAAQMQYSLDITVVKL